MSRNILSNNLFQELGNHFNIGNSLCFLKWRTAENVCLSKLYSTNNLSAVQWCPLLSRKTSFFGLPCHNRSTVFFLFIFKVTRFVRCLRFWVPLFSVLYFHGHELERPLGDADHQLWPRRTWMRCVTILCVYVRRPAPPFLLTALLFGQSAGEQGNTPPETGQEKRPVGTSAWHDLFMTDWGCAVEL